MQPSELFLINFLVTFAHKSIEPMKNTFILFVFIFGFIVSGCQSEPTSSANNHTEGNEKIFGNLYIRYIRPDNQLKAEASFTKGKTKKDSAPFKPENGVLFDGNQLMARKILNNLIKYSTEQIEKYRQHYEFSFNIDGQEIRIPLKINAIDSIIFLSNANSKGMTFRIPGEKFSKNESLVALISDKNDYAISVVIPNINSDNSFNIPPKDLSKLKSGQGHIYLVRKAVNHLQDKGYELNTTTEYYSKSVPVTIPK